MIVHTSDPALAGHGLTFTCGNGTQISKGSVLHNFSSDVLSLDAFCSGLVCNAFLACGMQYFLGKSLTILGNQNCRL